MGPHLTQCRLGQGLPPYQVASIKPFGHNRHGTKFGGYSPFWGRGLGPHLTQSRLAEAYLHTKRHFDASSCLATIEMGRKLGALPLFEEGSWVPI